VTKRNTDASNASRGPLVSAKTSLVHFSAFRKIKGPFTLYSDTRVAAQIRMHPSAVIELTESKAIIDSRLWPVSQLTTRRRSESAYIRQVNFVRNNGP